MSTLRDLHSKLICFVVGKRPVILNMAVGIPDKNESEWISRVDVLHSNSKDKNLLIKNTKIYKPTAECKKTMGIDIDYNADTTRVSIDPAELP